MSLAKEDAEKFDEPIESAPENDSAKKSKYKPKIITRLQKYLAAIAGDATAPEPVTNEEKLLYNIAEKANDPTDDKFIVTLTPTSESGGTMDRSNVEIYEAAMSGKSIYFAINFSGIDCVVQATLSASFQSYQYPSFNAYGIATDGQTIINLYVNPADEESYSFTMDAVEIGGGSGGEESYLNVKLKNQNGTWSIEYDYDGTLNDAYENGKLLVLDYASTTAILKLRSTEFICRLMWCEAPGSPNDWYLYQYAVSIDAATEAVTATPKTFELTVRQ